MDLVRFVEREQGEPPSGQMNAFLILAEGSLRLSGRPVKAIMMTAEKQKRIWDPKTQFFTYEEVYPNRSQKGIAVISEFKVDDQRDGKLTLVISPDPNNTSGRHAQVAGQMEFS
ncbi:MAG: hypothetical protein JO110_28505 [Acetobacteraceae bacterium]|nr:hypothetical protein [Acetobacteraceae bacterium]